MGGQVLVGAIDVGLVTAGAGDRAAQLVGDPHRGGAAEVLHHVDVRVAPVRQLLRLGRFGVGEAAGAEHGEEQLDGPERTRAPVDQARPLAREVDEGLFAGAVHLPHRGPQPPRPLPVDLAELGVAVAARMDAGVLLPEQLQRDTVPLELAVDIRAVRQGPIAHGRRTRKQVGLERSVVLLRRQRPADPARGRLSQIAGNRTRTDGAGLRDLPVGQSLLVLESQNLPNLPHQQPPSRHRLTPCRKGEACPRSGYRRAFKTPGTG